jgi:hypothetical protein
MSYTYFMDDSGNSNLYGEGRYWVLGGIAMPEASWPHISNSVHDLRTRWKVPADRELKWQDVGKRIAELTNPLRRRHPDVGLSVAHITEVGDLEQLSREMVAIVAEDPAIRVLSAICVKQDALRVCGGEGSRDAVNGRCYRDMFHDAIERYEYFLTTLANRHGAFGHVVVDQKSQQFDDTLRATCADLLTHGTQYTRVTHVIDGVMVAPSHHSRGLQVADFVAGAIHRWFEYNDDRYLQIVYDNLHTDWMGDVLGAGIKRYPSTPAYGSGPLMLPEQRQVLIVTTVDPFR